MNFKNTPFPFNLLYVPEFKLPKIPKKYRDNEKGVSFPKGVTLLELQFKENEAKKLKESKMNSTKDMLSVGRSIAYSPEQLMEKIDLLEKFVIHLSERLHDLDDKIIMKAPGTTGYSFTSYVPDHKDK